MTDTNENSNSQENLEQPKLSWADEMDEFEESLSKTSLSDKNQEEKVETTETEQKPEHEKDEVGEQGKQTPTRPEREKKLPANPPFTAYVSSISEQATKDELAQLFQDCKVKEIRFVLNRETGKPKGFAYVEFQDQASLRAALKLEGSSIAGKPIHIAVSREFPTSGGRGGKSPREPVSKERGKEDRRASPRHHESPRGRGGKTKQVVEASPKKPVIETRNIFAALGEEE